MRMNLDFICRACISLLLGDMFLGRIDPRITVYILVAYLIAGCWFLLGRAISLLENLIPETLNPFFYCMSIYKGVFPCMLGNPLVGKQPLISLLLTMSGIMA